MPKKRSVKLEKQLNVRVTAAMYDRVETVSNQLSIDPSDLVRIILAEQMSVYEDRAAKAAPHGREKPKAG